ncbi:putative baseplate assembly protein [Brevibacillus borstelensis]|uniref:putative baseplate assembly protein n=1 Tax=Brevibacillus borstelensis TaxID=45462 RepID=UPI0030BD211D
MRPPLVDPSDVQALIRKMREMAPFYTPEWRFAPESPDPGTALFFIFVDMLMNNIERLNQVPQKNFIAFLSMLDVSLASARPAEAYLTFELSTGAPQPVWIPSGTRVSGKTAEGEEIVFETERPILATPALLADLFLTNGNQDFLSRLSDSAYEDMKNGTLFPLSVFDTGRLQNDQRHYWYLSHNELFRLSDRAVIQLSVSNERERYLEPAITKKLADAELVEWAYFCDGKWVPFDEVISDQTNVMLVKKQKNRWETREINGIEGRWLRCRVKPLQIDRMIRQDGGLALSSLKLKADYLPEVPDGGLIPDMIFANDVQAAAAGCYPFGEQFASYGMFFLACEEAFTKPGSRVTLRFRMKVVARQLLHQAEQEIKWKLIMKESAFAPPPSTAVAIASAVWEYWNGSGWVTLAMEEGAEAVLASRETEERTHSLTFCCPSDFSPTFVHSQHGYWIRVRILQVEGLYGPNPVYMAPWLDQISLRYEYPEAVLEPNHSLSVNNLDWQLYSSIKDGAIGEGVGLIRPFAGLDCKSPALYLGFESQLSQGPVSLYISLSPADVKEGPKPLTHWEYLTLEQREPRWVKLHAVDQTSGLTESGTVRFAVPPDMAKVSVFGRERYWLRLANPDGRMDPLHPQCVCPVIEGLYLNTTRAVQQETIRSEMADPTSESLFLSASEYRLSRFPVITEEVWVDETGWLTSEQQEKLASDPAHKVEEIRDSGGNVQKCWVQWRRVEHLHDSGSEDRHYALDRASGKISFGDGHRGKALPQSGKDKVKVTYKIGGGKKGNLPAGAINHLENSIPFVQAVYNPQPAVGGCDLELLEHALVRGPKTIKNRNRAVTTEDFEWLAKSAHPGVAKVKCLPHTNGKLQREAGHVTVVVLPAAGSFDHRFFELKRQVAQYLLKHAAATVALPESIHVIEPDYLEISVTAELAVGSLEDMVVAEMEALRRLEQFLDPLSGNFNGSGWEIGQSLHPSLLFALLKSVPRVRYVNQLTINVSRIANGQRTEISLEAYDKILHGIVVGGKHRIAVRVL